MKETHLQVDTERNAFTARSPHGCKGSDAPPSRAPYTIDYAYDHKGRMVRKEISRGGAEAQRIEYLWDGWNIIKETTTDLSTFQPFNLSTFQPFNLSTCYYIWGLDLNGTLQGAGGVGGLLAVIRSNSNSNSNSTSPTPNFSTHQLYLPTYDANGNVSEYIDANDGTIVAHYDYSPFGEILIQTGDLASSFTHRFSTKPYCSITKLVEYQLRKYRPEIGRWLSKDPIGEKDLLNLYLHIGNSPANNTDSFGLWTLDDSSYGKARLVYIKDAGDSISSLATTVDLDPSEADKWGKIESASDGDVGIGLSEESIKTACSVSVPNVWIDADLLRGGTLYYRIVNIGGTIGSFFGTDLFTSGKHQILTVGKIPDLMGAIRSNNGDLWGMTVYGHGSKDGDLLTPSGDSIPQIQIYYAIIENEYKLSAINMMQCYSGGETPTPNGPIDMSAKWRSAALHSTVYLGVNFLGMDLHL